MQAFLESVFAMQSMVLGLVRERLRIAGSDYCARRCRQAVMKLRVQVGNDRGAGDGE